MMTRGDDEAWVRHRALRCAPMKAAERGAERRSTCEEGGCKWLRVRVWMAERPLNCRPLERAWVTEPLYCRPKTR